MRAGWLLLPLLLSPAPATRQQPLDFGPGWNGQAETPPMGWRPWNCFRNVFTQQTAHMSVDALSARNRTVKGEPGLVSLCDLGYCRVGIDEGYEARSPNGSMHGPAGLPLINKQAFPDIAALVAHAHSKPNMKMEWYLNSCWHGGPQFNTTRNYEGDVRALQGFKFVSPGARSPLFAYDHASGCPRHYKSLL